MQRTAKPYHLRWCAAGSGTSRSTRWLAAFSGGSGNFCTNADAVDPFKAVCLLGMNDQDYPRQVTPVGFDLMVQGERVGEIVPDVKTTTRS